MIQTGVMKLRQSFHDGGVRSQYDIVLILSHRVVPFGFEHTDHPERYLVEADDFPYRIASVRKEVVYNRFTDHADLSRTLYIGFRKHISTFYTQLTDVKILQPDTADRKSTRLNSSHRSLSRMPSSA